MTTVGRECMDPYTDWDVDGIEKADMAFNFESRSRLSVVIGGPTKAMVWSLLWLSHAAWTAVATVVSFRPLIRGVAEE